MASDGEKASSGVETRIVVLPPTSADAQAIGKLLGGAGMRCKFFLNMPAMCEAIKEGAGAVIVSEESLASETDALAACVQGQPVWSDLPIIVLSRVGAESMVVSQAIPRIGNVSVVERPMRVTTLISLVRSCLRARDRQYEVRDQMIAQARSQAALREADERYRLLVENIADYAIFMTDTAGNVTSWNTGAEQTLGYGEEEAIGMPAALLFTPEDREAHVPEQEMARARQTGRSADVRWHLRKNGERIFVEGVLTAVHAEDGSLLGYSKLMKDITDRHEAEVERERLLASERAARSEAERAGHMKDEFLATVSHELRTPLNAILGWSQIMRSSDDKGDIQEGLEVIERNARAQTKIIEDLLDMSRIISGKVRLDVQHVDVIGTLAAAIDTVRPAAQAKGIQLQVMLDPRAPVVDGDPNRLHQVFWNILTNAVKFTPKGGRITVRLGLVDSHVEANIADTGEGIDPEFLPYVFDRFRQADASTTRRHGGLGLGLSIVKQLVELHGGTVLAQSPGKGQGSAFRITLPLIATHSGPASAADPAPGTTEGPLAGARKTPCEVDLSGMRVLVVDDEPDARQMLRRFLEGCNATVTACESAADAVVRMGSEKYDVIVSDIAMPQEDGYEFIRRVRSMAAGHGAETPAIALTAYARSEDRVKAMNAGFQSHLSKPVEPTQLIATVDSLRRTGGAPSGISR